MIRLKVRLHLMRHHLDKCFAILLLCFFCGCGQSSWTQKKWLTEVAIAGGFSTNTSTALSDLNEYGLVDVYEYALDEPLTLHAATSTCASLLQGFDVLQLFDALDISSMDENTVLSQLQAEMALNWMIDKMNSFDAESHQQIIYVKEPVNVQIIDRDNEWIRSQQILQLNDLIEIDGAVFQVIEINEEWYRLEEADYEDVDEMDLSGSMDLNLDDAQITVQNEVVEMNEVLGAGLPVSRLSKTFEIQGFTVRFSASSDSLHIYASRKTSSGLPLFVQFDINEITCDFKWKTKQDDVVHAGVKVGYETTLTSGFRTARYNDRVLDFSKMNQMQLIESIKNAFVPEKDCLEETLELAEIQLPFPNLQACTLKMKVVLHLYASGKAEIAFESDHTIGFEKIDGRLRLINESEKDSHVSLRASAKASTQLQFIVSVLGKDCMDAAAELGIQGSAVGMLALRETAEQLTSDVPYELAEEFAQSSEKLVACADLDAYWLFNLIFNSRKSLLGSLGLGKTYELVNECNGSLFGKSLHIENFQPVEQCTRKLKPIPLPTIDAVSNRIELKHYLLVLDENQSVSIAISSLPEEFQFNDVIFSSLDAQIATVNSKGMVTAHQSGQTIVKVSLKDGSHEVQCSIFVR